MAQPAAAYYSVRCTWLCLAGIRLRVCPSYNRDGNSQLSMVCISDLKLCTLTLHQRFTSAVSFRDPFHLDSPRKFPRIAMIVFIERYVPNDQLKHDSVHSKGKRIDPSKQ